MAQPKARKEHRHLATVKQRSGQSAVNVAENDQILPAIEPKFWESLANTGASVQVIVLDNKEPPADVQDTLNVHLFAGPDGPRLGLRAGFIPRRVRWKGRGNPLEEYSRWPLSPQNRKPRRSGSKLMRLYYFTSANYGLQNIEKRRIKIARIKDLNDPFEFIPLRLPTTQQRKRMREMKRQANKKYGIVCFTSDWTHPMMWSHYGDRHRGICLGFDVIQARPIIPIEYTEHLLEEKHFKDQQIHQISTLDHMRTWFVKYDAWKYEDEQRMVFRLEDQQSENGHFFHSFEPALRLAEVVVGAESSVTRERVLEAVGDLRDVELIKARLAFKRFAVVKQEQDLMWKKTEDLSPEE
ncbi:DUF2971 domain-containing protein [Aliirhizobium terrae]|uniref:DUF2971 domain-containing protein n=1 Tax=Terrirhizobium terrae TaxID=2926709 RepID=UPI0025763875|nr:DUF2971 domain-containing protein [Rhizobium sp. CC-CFT758]WJH40585.1 DUF2971 domain-containing protein [Rhizobium sp. CC-CFT758]